MQIVLYYAPIACSMVPYINLTEAGASFEVETINLGTGQQMSPQYLKINPKHKVPLLVVDGRTLSENVAIHAWIARQFPDAGLMPADPWDLLQAISIMSWCSGGIHPYLARMNNTRKVCDVADAPESVKALATGPLTENFKIADDMLAGRDYLFGHYTGPDAHLFWTMRRAQQLGLDLSQFQHATAHHTRMLQRPSVRKLIDFETATLKRFAAA
ncbi:MAG: glutathione S-transferase family protein [Hyphomicrobiaceae bacterium]